jgi:alkanesulfonate monooxygenase
MRLRFHWRLIEAGEAAVGADGLELRRHASSKGSPDLAAQARFCRDAEQAGIDSLLVDVGFAKPDPMVLGLTLARLTDSIHFLVACRPGLMSPTIFVQRVNTFSVLADGRIRLNVVSGHAASELAGYGDELEHDARFARMDEFLSICRAFWESTEPVEFSGSYYKIRGGRLRTPFVSCAGKAPEILVGGNSKPCREVAARRADCWVRFPLAAEELAQEIGPVLDAGKQVGLRMAVVARLTRGEAIDEARRLADVDRVGRTRDLATFIRNSDSESINSAGYLARSEWLSSCLWTGIVPTAGITSVCLLGSYDEVAEELIALGRIGVSQFILSGWPKWGEMIRFGREVVPRVRSLEVERSPARRRAGYRDPVTTPFNEDR